MADLISREEILIKIKTTQTLLEGEKKDEGYIGGILAAYKKFEEIIKEQPPADIERHAHWIKNKIGQRILKHNNDIIDICSYECSNCHKTAGKVKFDYCHFCGCKMDEE